MKRQKVLLLALLLCLCAALCSAVYLQDDTPPIYVEQPQVSLKAFDDPNASPMAYFVYDGRVYFGQPLVKEREGVLGEHLGRTTGLLPFWGPMDGYVDFAGTVVNEIYTVNGMNPEVVLCAKLDQNKLVRYFVCNGGITISSGREWFEDRMQLSEKLEKILFYNAEDYETSTVDKDLPEVKAFLRALNKAEPVDSGMHLELPPEAEIRYNADLVLDNGVKVRMDLYEGGYVVSGISIGMLFQVSQPDLDAFCAFLQEHHGNIAADDDVGMTLEELRTDADLGKYFPDFAGLGYKTGFRSIFYTLDTETGKEAATRKMDCDFGGKGYTGSLAIEIREERENATTGFSGGEINAADVSEETLAAFVRTHYENGKPIDNGRGHFGVTVWFGDVAVTISGYGMDEKEAYALIASIPAFAEYM
ncbi:MAG: hypothetical protein IKU17_04810 [Clostridia bacterium]|nr:hypothetical protein [Clostridia bacterium]